MAPSPVLAAFVSALHVLGVALALSSIFFRTRSLAGRDLPAALRADNVWGLSALVLIGSGLWRAFGGLEKGTVFYLASPLFRVKLGLVGAVLLLELVPMVMLIRWRVQQARGQEPDTSAMGLLAGISAVEGAIILTLPFVAAAMARGVGL